MKPLRPMRIQEAFEVHCRFCFDTFEGPTVEEALKKVQDHERKEHPGK